MDPELGVAQWSKIEGDLPETANVTGGILYIPYVSLGDSGFHECRGSNEDDGVQRLTEIVVVSGTVEVTSFN